MNQLVRFTNAYSGDFVYVAQSAIAYFSAHTAAQPSGYKEKINMWITLGKDEEALPVAEEVNYLLSRFPPL